jgi:hypothetical protein
MIVHYHAIAEPFRNWRSPAQQEAILKMTAQDLIRPCHIRAHAVCLGYHDEQPGMYTTTKKGKDWVKRLLHVPCQLDS